MILAPLTRGGNYPFRRLCQDFGMKISIGEMVFARNLLRGDPIERARLRKPLTNQDELFGVLPTMLKKVLPPCVWHKKQVAGADFVDMNTGCPLYEATR